jgi:hypothetical protein
MIVDTGTTLTMNVFCRGESCIRPIVAFDFVGPGDHKDRPYTSKNSTP